MKRYPCFSNPRLVWNRCALSPQVAQECQLGAAGSTALLHRVLHYLLANVLALSHQVNDHIFNNARRRAPQSVRQVVHDQERKRPDDFAPGHRHIESIVGRGAWRIRSNMIAAASRRIAAPARRTTTIPPPSSLARPPSSFATPQVRERPAPNVPFGVTFKTTVLKYLAWNRAHSIKRKGQHAPQVQSSFFLNRL